MHLVDSGVMSGVGLPESVTRVVGVPKESVDSWGINKRPRKSAPFDRCKYPDSSGAIVQTWPLSELSLETIRERWGDDGEYRVCWFNGQTSEGGGRVFGFDAPEPARVRTVAPETPAPAAPIASRLPSELLQTFELMGILQAQSSAQLKSTLEVAAAMSRGNSGGLDASVLMMIVQTMQASSKEMLTAMQAQHAEQMALLRTALVDEGGDEDDDDGEGVVTTVAKATAAAAPFMKKGQDIKSAIVNHLTQNPADLFEAIKSVPAVMGHLSQLMQAQNVAAAAAPPPATPAVETAPVRPRAARVEPSQPGLNMLLQEKPAPVVEASAPVVAAAE